MKYTFINTLLTIMLRGLNRKRGTVNPKKLKAYKNIEIKEELTQLLRNFSNDLSKIKQNQKQKEDEVILRTLAKIANTRNVLDIDAKKLKELYKKELDQGDVHTSVPTVLTTNLRNRKKRQGLDNVGKVLVNKRQRQRKTKVDAQVIQVRVQHDASKAIAQMFLNAKLREVAKEQLNTLKQEKEYKDQKKARSIQGDTSDVAQAVTVLSTSISTLLAINICSNFNEYEVMARNALSDAVPRGQAMLSQFFNITTTQLINVMYQVQTYVLATLASINTTYEAYQTTCPTNLRGNTTNTSALATSDYAFHPMVLTLSLFMVVELITNRTDSLLYKGIKVGVIQPLLGIANAIMSILKKMYEAVSAYGQQKYKIDLINVPTTVDSSTNLFKF